MYGQCIIDRRQSWPLSLHFFPWRLFQCSSSLLSTAIRIFCRVCERYQIVYCTNKLFTVTPIAGRRTTGSIQILNFSSCKLQPVSPILPKLASIFQITYAAAMCILVVVQFVRVSVQMYRATKRWQLNRYMSLLARQGILYFFAYVPVSTCPCLLRCLPGALTCRPS